MTRTTITISLILFTLCAFSSLDALAQERTEERRIDGFTGVSLGVSGHLHVAQGPDYKVVLKGDPDVLQNIETYVRAGVLRIRDDRKWSWNLGNREVSVWVTLPEVEYLAVSGSGKLIAETPVQTGSLEIHVSGSGRTEIGELQADQLETSISGSGNVFLGEGGPAREINIRISGSGNLHADHFEAAEADISISGSGDCSVFITERLDARISGSGSVLYRGNPGYLDSRISGSGKIRKGR